MKDPSTNAETEIFLGASRAIAEKAAVFALCDSEYALVGEPDAAYIASTIGICKDRAALYLKMWKKEKDLVGKTKLPYALMRHITSLYSEILSDAQRKETELLNTLSIHVPELKHRFKHAKYDNITYRNCIAELLRIIKSLENQLSEKNQKVSHYYDVLLPEMTSRIDFLENLFLSKVNYEERN